MNKSTFWVWLTYLLSDWKSESETESAYFQTESSNISEHSWEQESIRNIYELKKNKCSEIMLL